VRNENGMLSNLNYQLKRIYESVVKTSPASSGVYCTCLLQDLTFINLLSFFKGQKVITMPCVCAHVCVCVCVCVCLGVSPNSTSGTSG